ncbi:MAG TPA: class I SAM-dependent methyltransferase [Gemmata sp.]|nr:class I SAM-dependent methyltransferase [Gemmata sp.]
MISRARDCTFCKSLLVTDTNLLDNTFEAQSDRELLRSLAALGVPCEAIGRLTISGDRETDPVPWLAEQGWKKGEGGFPIPEEFNEAIRVEASEVPITLFRGTSTRPHVLDEGERNRFRQLIEIALDRGHPAVVVARPSLILADVLAAARFRGIATIALQPDCTPRDPAVFREADVVLTPSSFASHYLREAFGLPCTHLPPVVAGRLQAEETRSGAVVFDATAPGSGLLLFAQIAEELGRRRPGLPVVLIGANGSLDMPKGGTLRCIPRAEADAVWASARVCVAPMVGWEYFPQAALSALSYGVPTITSDRGAGPEMLGSAALVLPLPERITTTFHSQLQPAELAPWVEMILRICDDRSFADRQRGLVVLASQRLAASELAHRYAEFLSQLAASKSHSGSSANLFSTNGHTIDDSTAVRSLTESHPWPDQRPEDAAPGQEAGWLGAGSDVMLSRSLSPKTKLVVELGAWLGLSTRFIADAAPRATVISVDHWKGSPEHQTEERFRALLPRLYETFQSRCWKYRDRVVPLRMSSLDGLRQVAEAGLDPDFIYVDAEHTYEAVTAELKLARELFPHTLLGGDDYDWQGVRQAVDEFAHRNGLVVDRMGSRGWRLLEGWQAADASQPPPGRGQAVVLVPHMNGIEWECEHALRQLESAGVRVVRKGGCSAIDVARNELASDAIHEGAEAMLFVDSDIGFDPADALRLLARPEPVAAGVYPKKGMRELASVFAEGVKEVLFGPEVPGPYPLKYAATGFLRIKAGVLRQMIAELRLPLCNTHWGRGVWPFFQPLIVPQGTEKWHYLGEDWAFSHRLGQIGVTPIADTSIRLWHWGRYSFGWEDAGSTVSRYRSYSYNLAPSPEPSRVGT